jgi:hypothetical protein
VCLADKGHSLEMSGSQLRHSVRDTVPTRELRVVFTLGGTPGLILATARSSSVDTTCINPEQAFKQPYSARW